MADREFQVIGHAPVLYVRHTPRSLAYYGDKLGFTVTFTWRGPPHYICLRLGQAVIHLHSFVPPARTSHVCIFCKGVDALYAHLTARGANMVQPIDDRPYGMRDFALTDPDGHRLVFAQGITQTRLARSTLTTAAASAASISIS